MLCIAAFFVFILLGIFSATHRRLAAKSWYCISRKITFRPCDINFNEELKGQLLGKLIFTHPRLAKFLERWVDVFALAFVVLSLWSLFAVVIAGLNLFVYDTCDPHQAESCSLGGEACGVGTGQLTWWEGIATGQPHVWAWGHMTTFGETVQRIPDRFRTWDPAEIVDAESSYYRPYDDKKPVMVEIIDPSCRFCAKQFRLMKDAGLSEDYNLTYVLYPIPNPKDGGYKFPHSLQLATVVELLRTTTFGDDWKFLEGLFTQQTDAGVFYGEAFGVVSSAQSGEMILELLERTDISETGKEVIKIYLEDTELGKHAEETVLRRQQNIDAQIHIQKIPTLFKDGRRFDRVVEFE